MKGPRNSALIQIQLAVILAGALCLGQPSRHQRINWASRDSWHPQEYSRGAAPKTVSPRRSVAHGSSLWLLVARRVSSHRLSGFLCRLPLELQFSVPRV